MTTTRRRDLSLQELEAGVRARNPAILGRAISLIESSTADDRRKAGELMLRLLPYARHAIRIGITGPPGVGKSTLIEALGTSLTAQGKRVAVLAVDPSSEFSGGSVLGDKTRMERLAADAKAFIRPTATHGVLGGVAARTGEAVAICESAGFDVIVVETVGVGQSETMVADLTDVFVVLVEPGGGDELQGIKRGLMERADLIAVTKADGTEAERARHTAHDYRMAMRLVRGNDHAPSVMAVSAQEGLGVRELWQQMLARRELLSQTGELDARRRRERIRRFWMEVQQEVRHHLESDAHLGADVETALREVERGSLPPAVAAERVLGGLFRRS